MSDPIHIPTPKTSLFCFLESCSVVVIETDAQKGPRSISELMRHTLFNFHSAHPEHIQRTLKEHPENTFRDLFNHFREIKAESDLAEPIRLVATQE